jgi:acetyl esterase/lipase
VIADASGDGGLTGHAADGAGNEHEAPRLMPDVRQPSATGNRVRLMPSSKIHGEAIMERRRFLAAAAAAAAAMRVKITGAEKSPLVGVRAVVGQGAQKLLTKAERIFARDAAYLPTSNTDAGRRILAGAPPNVRGYGNFAPFLNDVAYGRIKVADSNAATPETVVAHRDIVFARVGGKELKLDLFTPANSTKLCPIVVLIHGGCWLAGTRQDYTRFGIQLASRGYAAASIDYRLSEEASYPAAIEDCRTAIQWLNDHASTYGIDRERIALLGGSAGGHLAEYVGYAASAPAERNGPRPKVKAVVAFFAWSDLTHPSVRDFYWNEVFLGKKYEEAPALYKEASPITHVSKQSPPTLLLHGTIDTIVPPSQSVLLVEKLEANGVPYLYAPFLGLYHAFTIDVDATARAMYFIERFLGEYLTS